MLFDRGLGEVGYSASELRGECCIVMNVMFMVVVVLCLYY